MAVPLNREQVIERAKARKMPPVEVRSRSDAVLDGDPLYTPSEAAAILGIRRESMNAVITRSMVPALLCAPMLATTRRVHIRRIRHSDLAKYMKRTDTMMSKEELRANKNKMRRIKHAKQSLRRNRVNGPASSSKPQTTPNSHER
jgi:hypothetical protein